MVMISGKSYKKYLSLFMKREEGIFSVEFALVLPFLLLMIFGIIEVGLIMFSQSLMEGALRDASRYGVTGQIKDPDLRLAEIKKIIEDRVNVIVDVSTAEIEVLTYPSFSRIGDGEAYLDGNGNSEYDLGETFTDENGNGIRDSDIGTVGAGGADNVVLYRIRYDWPIVAGFVKNYIGEGGKLPLVASIAVRNEPWDLTR